jgi:uncharacterized glyoxalase superfamily protein PhnB
VRVFRRATLEETMNVQSITPNLIVEDVHRSVQFYRQLGFKLTMHVPEEEPFVFAGMEANGAFVFLNDKKMLGPELPAWARAHGGALTLYIKLTGFDEVLKTARQAGMKFVQEPETQFYGMREFAVEDPDGFVLTFAEEIKK